MVMIEAANEAAAAAAAAATIEIGHGDIGRGNKNDHWLQNLSKFLSAMEDEGLLGLAQSVIAKSNDIVASVASSAVGTAIHVVSSSGAAHFVDGPQNHVWNEDEENDEEEVENGENLVSRTKCSSEHEVAYHDPAITTLHHCRDESHHCHRDNSPFGIFSIASTIANIMLGAISPLLVQQRQHHHTHYSHRCNVVEAKDRKLLKKYDGTTSSSKEPIFLHAEMNPSYEHFDLRQFLDANESCCRSSSSHAESVYYDATSSTRSLSTTDSFVSSDDADENNDDDGDHIGEVEILGHDHTNFPQHVVMPEQKESTNNGSTNTTQNFYLDVTDLLSKEERDILISTCNECIVCKDSSTFYVVCDSVERNETFRRVLDILVERSFSIAQMMDDGCSSPLRNEEVDTNHGEFCWKPDDRTKKYLERQQRNSITVEEWTHILETEVLKWTSSDRNSNCPMLKTRGIIDMSPLELKELLLDCQRNHLYNKNAISKTNMHCFADIVIGGETKIVQNVMKIPIVGGAIQIVSLTHVRCIENGGFILVSQSVGDNANTNPANPYYSISILRSISNNEQKTELTNITQISSMPIPKFLMQKVGLMGATDFFNNIRSLCN